MASTTQSARDYIESARVHLVRELKNLSVIVENLYQQKVFSDEEVSKIQTERDDFDKTSKILDSVTKKGEAACYKFLRIIDMTRKRTLERASVLPEKQSAASTENRRFDLHHWISCYPFKEDTQMDVNYLQGSRPCHRYQAKLKSKAQKISNKFWMANKNLFEGNNPDLSYTALVLDKQGGDSPSKIKKLKSKKRKLSRPKKMKTYIPKDRPGTSPSDLLKTDENILLVGKPGIGKTALSHELLRLWAERDNEELDYMFYFDMRETSHITKAMSLEDLLFSVFSEPDEGREEVLQDIKRNSDNVTIIFDGITDLSSSVVKKLVEKDLLPDAKVIVTCRPDNEEDFGDFLRVEVKGFSEQTTKTYLSAILGDAQKKVLSNLELLTLCHVPMYALMVAACFSSETPEDSSQPCSITEIYINIVRFCLQMNSNKTKNIDLNSFIENKSEEILSLAEVAFHATEGKTVNLTKLPREDSCVLCFLKSLVITEAITTYAFLHYTMQEFFAAIWLLKNPDKIKEVFQQCLTTEKKHMKHLIPFMCRLLTEKSPSLMKCLISAQELRNTSNWFFKEMINRFLPYLCETDKADTEDSGLDVDILFLCQCLFESQCPEACFYFLDKLDYRLDLSGKSLGPYPCCAVAYVVTQSKEKKIYLNLEDVMVSEQGMRRLFGCLQNVQWCDPLPRQLWEVFLLSEEQMDYRRLLDLDGNQLHLPVEGKRRLFERAVKVMQKSSTQVNVCLHWDRATPACQSLHESLLEALPHISSLSFRMTNRGPGLQDQEQCHGTPEREEKQLLLDLCLKAAALYKRESFHNVVSTLLSLFSVNTDLNNILLDFYQHVKSKGCSSVIPKLRSLFQSPPSVWSINLSERKTSILLEVLKLQSEKKQVKLTGCSHEESEVRSFLQCLPYISQLSFVPQSSEPSEETKFFGNLLCAAAEREQQTGEKILELLSSVCRYKTFPLREQWCDFLLDLYSYGSKTGLSVLPSLQSVPEVWSINLSERKTSILLEVLKLQSEKKQVELTGCSHEESEVRSFLQCLPYISQLSVSQRLSVSIQTKFFGNLFCAAAEREQQTGKKILELLSSVCSYETFPYMDDHDDDGGGDDDDDDDDDHDDDEREYRCDFLLDLYSHLKDYETKTGLSVLPSLQSVLQSAPAVWSINLSKRKTSILLEVLKLQSEKKQVKLTGWSYEESEMRSFLQCLPYISQLSFPDRFKVSCKAEFLWNLFCAAAEREQQTGEKMDLSSSVCRYEAIHFNYRYIYGDDDKEYHCDFLLDLCSHVKDYETKTGLSVLPSLQSVLQSAPAVWSINLSERKTSILLEVLKLQSEKKQVKLTDCSHEESEVRGFLQCLPYISQLSFVVIRSYRYEETKFFGNLFCAAAEREQQTGEKILELLSSVCRYETFLVDYRYMYGGAGKEYRCDFLLDLYSHLKDYETKTGLSVLPSLQSVLQSAPAVWSINLSERKTSILLEVLKLQSEKKQVKLTGCSHEESEVRSFLQCLPYISQLSFVRQWSDPNEETKFLANLFCAAAEREQQTGENILELLSSVCRYKTCTFKYMDGYEQYQCDFLLDLCSHVKDYETKTGLSVLPSLQSVLQSVSAVWSINLSERKTSILLEVLKLQSEKKQVKLTGCSHEESEVRSFLQCLPYISQLSFVPQSSEPSEETKFFGNLLCAAAERDQQTGEKILELLSSMCRYKTFPLKEKWCDFKLDLYSYYCETGLSVLPSLQSVLQSAPAVWSINLSERKTSILLEVLKLQSEKKQVKLTGCSHEESEVRSFLQCLPYISHLSFVPQSSDRYEETKFFGNLFCAAAEREQQTGEKILELLSSVCRYKTFPLKEKWCDFLLDLYSYGCETGLSVLPSSQSVLQSVPAVWSINLSERKTSILLEVLKLQSEKKHVKLTGCSHEESEVRSFLQCLPYISQLSVSQRFEGEAKFFGNLFCAAAEREQQKGEKILKLLSSVCRYETFPFNDMDEYDDDNEREYRCDFLLDLYSHLKDYETKTGLSVLPSLQSVLQSAPAVWFINLSERKTSILLEVLKLQSEKKQVKLTGRSHEESEVRSYLQCLPYISQLSFVPQSSDRYEETKFFGNLFCAAAEREQQTGEKILELLSSVCRYKTFPLREKWWDFQLDLYSYGCETGLSVLPLLQSVLQSAPAVWSINLSERKPSILLEVLKLQSEKKQVKLTGCSHEENEVRGFLQCLPYISQLSVSQRFEGKTKFFGNLFCAAADREQQTGEKILELLSSVCRYETFPLNDRYMYYDAKKSQCDFLLDLHSHLKDYETKTGLRVLPSLQSVFQSAPAVWFINLSERKTSILLEVLKLQSEKKQVKLTGCSHEESEVRSFLQCLPYISQLSFVPQSSDRYEETKFFGNLFCAAAEREQQTGEKILELLSSVCRYKKFPLREKWCDFQLDLYSYWSITGLSVLPSLQSVLQSAPAVWSINLSERKTSILLEVLKLQSEKKQVKLTDCSHEESEVRSFLQCLPYISQLSFVPQSSDRYEETKFFGNLLCAAAEREQQTGEKILELLSSVCSYKTFPLKEKWCDFLLDLYSYGCETGLSVLPSLQSVLQSVPAVWSINLSERKPSILLEVLKLQSKKKQVELTGCSHEESEVRSFLQCLPYISQLSFVPQSSDRYEETKFFGNLFCAAAEREQQTGEKILELLSSVCRYKTFPLREKWCDFLLDLYSYGCETGLSVLPSSQSVLQSAPAVWFINLSERNTSILLEVLKLQSEKKQVKLTGCSHEESEVRSFLQCLPYISHLSCDPEFFQSVCTLISVRSREDEEQLSSLLQLLGFTLQLTGELHTGTCRSVGRVLRLCGSDVDLILKPRKMSVRGASLLFRHTTQLHSLSLSSDMALLLFQWVRRGRAAGLLAIEELSLTPQTVPPSERVLLKVVSSLASLLRYWSVRQLDLTEFYVPAQGLIPLLLHHGPLTIKLSEKISLQLLSLIHEIQDKDLTQSFLSKVGGDLSSCCLNWELLHCLLQQSSDQIITVNLRKNRFLQENVTRLLPFLDRIVFQRPCPRFVLTAIREIYKACASPIIPSLLRSLDHVINLTCREMDSLDCAALLFTLKHSDRVKLNLVFTSIPTGQIESILFTLDKVSQLSVDRNLLLRFIHCCAASDAQQGAAVSLLRAVQHRLDLSCSSCVDLPEESQSETLSLTAEDCRAVSTILRRSSSKDTQLNLQDCELEDSRLDLLFPVLDRVRLRASKALLLQLLSLVPMNTERDTVRRAVSLCRALGGELDLSHTTLDQRACGALAQMLDFSEGLTDLDLSHCELTDQLLFTLITHLHKVQVLDLSHNKITDAAAHMLLQLVSINPSIDTVRLFSNNIVDRNPFKKHQQFEIW
ncbi:uncharacterized protein LOC127378595 isoform X1 [Dicentrarchus labrax]|uniref:uncharacterized protein LOC127378595 isoform X1 n=1 Tax=Dicentrarchus labrax TaxID=13489 RepID=UPI0021F5BFEE|nr:uncharacterized protein LOC127378595 isoform X1 [Dicentrarchus labrax]